MSYKSKSAATAAGEELAARMMMGTWTIHVHENMGWHVSIRWEHFSIRQYTTGNTYSLLCGYGGTGLGCLDSLHGDDPNDLVGAAVYLYVNQLKYYTDVSDWLKSIQP